MTARHQPLVTVTSPTRPAVDATGGSRGLLPDAARVGAPADGPFPLSYAQQRIWFTNELSADKAAYNVPWPMHVRGRLDAAVLERSLNAVVRRHAALRTAIVVRDGRPVQEIVAHAPIQLERVDLRNWPDPERDAEARRRLLEAARCQFDFERPPLIRALLLQTGDTEHLLLLTVHHIAADGPSASIVRHELAELYAAERAGREPSLPDLPVRYVDYAVWQRHQLAGRRLDDLLDHWRARLRGAPQVLELPADRPRPDVQTFHGSRSPWRVPAELVERLRLLSHRHGVTTFMALLAAFKALLMKHTGQTDVVVGAPIADRTRAELEPLIGCFTNMLVLRTDLAGDPTFSELLAQQQRVCTDAYTHQELPFERLVEALQPERDPSRHPLVQVTMQMNHAAGHALQLGDLAISPAAIGHARSPFDLSLLMFETDAGLDGAVEYATDLFDRETIDRLIARYELLLWSVVQNPGQRLSRIPVLTPGERRQVAVRWNATAAAIPECAVHELVEARAQRAPDAIAVACDEVQISYGELNRRANRLARKLRRAGVGLETRVGICLDRSAQLPIALLAVLKAGGAYVPVNPADPADRVRWMLEDTNAAAVLTEPAAAQVLGDRFRPLYVDAEEAAAGDDAEPAVAVPPAALAYVLHTSGSTGRPKGVAVAHQAVVNALTAIQREIPLASTDVMAAVTPITFDIAGLELFLPWMVGGRVELFTRRIAGDAPQLLSRIRSAGVTVVQATPSTWRLIIDAGWRGDPALRSLCGGEALPPDLSKALGGGSIAAWNLYGPTEATIWSASARIEPGAADVPIGRPLANTTAYAVGNEGDLAPVGVPGELYIGGTGVARGYLRRPALTAERFVPDPFGSTPGARLYRTGDLVRWRRDGRLLFLGRRDQQIKVRGFRIEPGEIESVLRTHHRVRDAVVVVRDDEGGERRLVAYVAATDVLPDALWTFARSHLPDYMVPADYVVLSRFPLTPNGKVDRAALPSAGEGRREPARTVPRSGLEQAIAGVWQEVLNVAPVGLHDRFFALGGSSLLLIRLLDRLRSQLGLTVTLMDLFRYPTIHDLVRHLSSAAERAEPAPDAAARAAKRERAALLRRRGAGRLAS